MNGDRDGGKCVENKITEGKEKKLRFLGKKGKKERKKKKKRLEENKSGSFFIYTEG